MSEIPDLGEVVSQRDALLETLRDIECSALILARNLDGRFEAGRDLARSIAATCANAMAGK